MISQEASPTGLPFESTPCSLSVQPPLLPLLLRQKLPPRHAATEVREISFTIRVKESSFALRGVGSVPARFRNSPSPVIARFGGLNLFHP